MSWDRRAPQSPFRSLLLGTPMHNLLKLISYFKSESSRRMPERQLDFGKVHLFKIMFLMFWLPISMSKIIYQENTGKTDTTYVSKSLYIKLPWKEIWASCKISLVVKFIGLKQKHTWNESTGFNGLGQWFSGVALTPAISALPGIR